MQASSITLWRHVEGSQGGCKATFPRALWGLLYLICMRDRAGCLPSMLREWAWVEGFCRAVDPVGLYGEMTILYTSV